MKRSPARIEYGQLWQASTENSIAESYSVVVLVPPDTADQKAPRIMIVAPISTEVDFAAGEDLLVGPADSPLGYAHMIEVWNEITLLDSQLSTFLGYLSRPAENLLAELYDVTYGFRVYNDRLCRQIGNPLDGKTDLRVLFQNREREHYNALREPARRQLYHSENTQSQRNGPRGTARKA